jgi:magnesium transporter
MDLLDHERRIEVFDLLRHETAAEVLNHATTEVAHDLIETVPDEKIADLLESLPMDDAAEVLSELKDERAEDLLALMEPQEAAEVETLLAYPEGTAGRLMSTHVVRLKASWTVDQTFRFLRKVNPEAETLAYLYVVNARDRLVGVVPLWALITAPTDKRLLGLMLRSVISVRVDTDQEKVAQVVSQYDFFAVPVVDTDGRLVGVITHDDVMDIIEEEFTEDAQRMGGSQPLDTPYLSTSIFTLVQKRIGWLVVLFLIEMITGFALRLFESQFKVVLALSFFIPLLIGTGGNSGSQVTSTIIRALAVGDVRIRDTWRLLWHEAQVGFLLSLVVGLIGFASALVWNSPVSLAIVVAASLVAIMLWANLIGTLLPPLVLRLRIDPAVISGPVMSTLVDATGLFIYFALAKTVIGT